MIIDFCKGYDGRIVIALGFFDSVHSGHRALINRTINLALEKNIESAVFTFADNLYKALGNSDQQIYTFVERVEIINNIGVNHIVAAYIDRLLKECSPLEFLDTLTNQYNIDTVVCGADFQFGTDAKGDINLLINYLESKKIKVEIVDMVLDKGLKISSSNIKKLLVEGNLVEANYLLQYPYLVMGEVIKGRGQGKFLGYPTANISIIDDKLRLAEGVYATAVLIDNKIYNSLTNVGSRPTFDDLGFNIETFLIDYNGKDLYGNIIKIYFFDRIRSITKFQNMEELSLQIKFDLAYSKTIERKL